MRTIIYSGPPYISAVSVIESSRRNWIANIMADHDRWQFGLHFHYDDVRMVVMASQNISLTIVYSTVYSDAHQSKHQSSASLAFVWGIHRGPVNSPHKWPVTRKMSPFDDVIMFALLLFCLKCNEFSREGWNEHDVQTQGQQYEAICMFLIRLCQSFQRDFNLDKNTYILAFSLCLVNCFNIQAIC